MALFKRNIRQRRLESRRNLATASLTLWQRLRDSGGFVSLLLAAGFYIIVVMMDVLPIDPLPYREGQYVQRDLYSRVHFETPSSRKMAIQRVYVEDSTPAILKLEAETLDKFVAALSSLPESVKAASQPSELPRAIQDQLALTPESLLAWQATAQEPQKQKFAEGLLQLRQELIKAPFIDHAQYESQMSRRANQVVLVRDGQTVPLSKMDLVDLGNPRQVASRVKDLHALFEPSLSPAIAKQLQSYLAQPNYIIDEVASAQAIAQALSELKKHPTSLVLDLHQPGELLVPRGEKIDATRLALLQAEHERYRINEARESPWDTPIRIIGRAGMLLLICLLLFIYIARYQGDIVRDHWHGFAVAATLLLALALNKMVMISPWKEPLAVLSVVTAATVLTIAFNQRLALMIAVVLSLLVVLQLRGNVGQYIILLSGAAASVVQLREIRSRSRLIEISAVSAVVVFLAVCAVMASWLVPWSAMRSNAMWAAVATLMVGFLVQGVLVQIERFFRVATSMTLLEWCDASKPLLKRLALEAPGTFNHSLQLGAMCEAAAESINARGLLARAGAYYHDIGKINKSDYFVENQGNMGNPHAKLSPAMSLLIIIGHVKDGLELARHYGLPAVLREFISSHHGTTLVQYFYHAATEQRKADVERAPDEVEFRYPGPKPRSKEAAILMLADASESSVRAMPEPTPGRIENQVHTMVTRRLMDGQLDECDLTLREVHRIEASLIRSLCGIYHSRIAYPKMASQKGVERRENGRNGNGGKSNGKHPNGSNGSNGSGSDKPQESNGGKTQEPQEP